MQRPHRYPWLGIGLIAFGVILLLQQLNVFDLRWHDTFWAIVFLGGIFLVVRGFTNQGGGVFLGVCAVAIGGYRLLAMHSDIFIPSYLYFPSLLVLAGVGILAVYATRPRQWHLLVPSVILMSLGGLIIMSEEGYFNRWELIDFIRIWWPAALVLFGTAMILNQGRKNHS
ncbi:MAG: DUF5668 domain-containing protein [Bacteroidota bacterium]